MVSRLQAKADELAARVKKGESLEAVAASAGASVARVARPRPRRRVQKHADCSQDLARQAVHRRKPGEVFTAHDSHFGFVVGKLEAVHAGDAATLARVVEQIRPQMTDGLLSARSPRPPTSRPARRSR